MSALIDLPKERSRVRVFATWRKDLEHVNKVRDNHFRMLAETFDLTLVVPESSRIGEHIPLDRMRLVRLAKGPFGLVGFYARALVEYLRIHRSRPFHVLWTVIGEEPVGWLFSRLSCPRPRLVFDLWDVPGTSLFQGWNPAAVARKIYRRVIRAVVKKGDLVVAGVVLQGLEHLDIAPERLVEARNGVVFSLFNPDDTAVDEEAWDSLPAGPRFLYHGYLDRMRGADDLLQAFAAMDPDVGAERALLLAGPGEPGGHERLRRLAANLGVAGQVRICESLNSSRIPGVVAGADVCICPLLAIDKYRWSYPVKIYEYLSMSKPVIASDQEGTRCVVREGQSALLYPPGDVDALRDCMERLAADGKLRESLGLAGRKDMVARDWTLCLEKLFTLVHDRLGGGGV